MTYIVIDMQTGKEADTEYIAIHEPWAQGLVYCDIEGWLLSEDGELCLGDECGNFAYAPMDRFKVEWQKEDDK